MCIIRAKQGLIIVSLKRCDAPYHIFAAQQWSYTCIGGGSQQTAGFFRTIGSIDGESTLLTLSDISV